MVSKRVLIVGVVCGVLFAGAPTRADDKKPTEPKKLTLLPLTVIDADRAVTVLNRYGYTQISRVPLFNALLVWGTDEEFAEIRVLLTPL